MQQLHIHTTLALCVHSCAYTLACACVCTFMLFLLIPIYTNVQWYKLCSEHQNDQTQEQFLPPSNPSHEHLTLTWNTQHYFTIFIHHTYIYIFFIYFFPFQICTSDLYTHDCLYCIVFLLFCTLTIVFVYCSFVVCVLSCCCHSVALWSFVTITNSSYV